MGIEIFTTLRVNLLHIEEGKPGEQRRRVESFRRVLALLKKAGASCHRVTKPLVG